MNSERLKKINEFEKRLGFLNARLNKYKEKFMDRYNLALDLAERQDNLKSALRNLGCEELGGKNGRRRQKRLL